MSSKRLDCPLCGGDIYPEHARGTATNTENGMNFMVCVHCDGAVHTPEKEKKSTKIHDNVKLIGVHDLPNKFIAIYGDGSGASIVKRWCSVYFIFAEDEEETKCTIDDIQDSGFVFFVPLPNNFRIFGDED